LPEVLQPLHSWKCYWRACHSGRNNYLAHVSALVGLFLFLSFSPAPCSGLCTVSSLPVLVAVIEVQCARQVVFSIWLVLLTCSLPLCTSPSISTLPPRQLSIRSPRPQAISEYSVMTPSSNLDSSLIPAISTHRQHVTFLMLAISTVYFTLFPQFFIMYYCYIVVKSSGRLAIKPTSRHPVKSLSSHSALRLPCQPVISLRITASPSRHLLFIMSSGRLAISLHRHRRSIRLPCLLIIKWRLQRVISAYRQLTIES
jgi:hypothetical protein